MVKIIFFDIDGTSFDNKNQKVHPSTTKALTLLREQGCKLFICTSRSTQEMCCLPQAYLNLFDGYVVNAGAMIYIDKKLVHKSVMKHEKIKPVIDKLDELELTYRWVAADNDASLNRIDPEKMALFYRLYSYVPPVKAYTNQDLCHLLFYMKNPEMMDEIRPLMDDMYVIDLGLAKEFVYKDINKGAGMRWVADHYGVSMEDVAAFGDGGNDVEMMEVAGYGIAMGNGKPHLKEVADYVTKNIDEDGLYHACLHYGWIKE
ncbi:MAG: HAD family hydrolase [Erysipelotrichaceae bacterium]